MQFKQGERKSRLSHLERKVRLVVLRFRKIEVLTRPTRQHLLDNIKSITTMSWFWQEKGKPPDSTEGLPAMRLFQLREAAFQKILYPGERIDISTWEALNSPAIVIIGNSQLKPDHFLLRPADYQAIGHLVYPGKSAMFDFTEIEASGGVVRKEAMDVFVQRSFGKKADRRDNLYHASVPDINTAGYEVFFGPVKTNGLHLRLVWKEHLSLEYPVLDTLPPIPESGRRALLSVWKKARVD